MADRDVARANRKANPALSQYGYKKAAEAARRAGDTGLELSILREAMAPAAPEPPVPDPASEAACAAPMREAAADITGAQAIEKNDPSCAGLLQAAENYFSAGRIFSRGIKPGMSQNQVANSCDFKKANEMFLRRDALIDRVDRMRAAGLCDPKTGPVNPPPPGTPPVMPPQQCEKDLAELGAQRKSLEGRTDGDATRLLNLIDAKTVELAAQGCRAAGAPPFTASACLHAALQWGLGEDVSASEVARRLKAAGCPPLEH